MKAQISKIKNEMSFVFEKLRPLVAERKSELDAWFAGAYTHTDPFFYCSVDLRHSGNKLVPVDTNLFPAGFNNLSEDAQSRASNEIKLFLSRYHEGTGKVLLIPESHTRNLFYLENLYVLKSLIENAGYIVRLGGLATEEKTEVKSKSGQKLLIEKLCREESQICVGDDRFVPDVVIVNNDLTSGAPEILKGIKQRVRPPVGMGWYRRSKTTHFDSYAHVVSEFSHAFSIDPWLISTSYHKCGQVNFKEKQGLECVALGVEKVLHRVKVKYQEYSISEEPYVFVKADNGTYGMGIMTAKSGDEIIDMNKKNRKKMNIIKEGIKNSEVIIQEGVPTIDNIDGKAAEPMMYLIGGKPVGCSFRVNEHRDAFSNLNAPGMEFRNACEGDEETAGEEQLCPIKSLIARLAALAAARECYEPGWEI